MIKVSEAIVKCLEKEHIKLVFGYPGAAICPFYDALSKSDIKHILVRQEANAGHSASGYARISGKPSVCIATSGPGATNLLTAIATAYMDSIPMIIITGQVSTEQIGRDVFQEADITGSAEPFVKHSYLVKNAYDIPHIFKEAFYIAGSGRPGPVLIDIPIDIQESEIDFSYPEKAEIRSYKPTIKGNKLQIKRVADALFNAKKPLICAGGGVFTANACEELRRLTSICSIPVVTTMMGLSCISPSDSDYIGMIGVSGNAAANFAMRECDVIMLVGARVGNRAVSSPVKLSETTKVIHIDIDPAEIGKNLPVDIPVVGNAASVLSQICDIIVPKEYPLWRAQLEACREASSVSKNSNGVNPLTLLSKLSDKLESGSVIVSDVGQNQLWSAHSFHVNNGRFMTSGGLGTMGYSIPAAIGAKLADKSKAVVAVCGDGAFQMNFMELATAKANGIDIKIALLNNSALAMVRNLQKKQYDGNLYAVSLDGNPDFIKLSEAYGIDCVRVSSSDEIDSALDRLVSSKGIFLIECMIDADFEQ